MNILSRFLYLFQCISIVRPKSFFSEFTSTDLIIYMRWKTPRIQKEFLHGQNTQGGLALPNFRYDYWAANILKVLYWLNSQIDLVLMHNG